jgi:hypothetical protein
MAVGPFSARVKVVGRMAGAPGAELYWMGNLRDDQWEPLVFYMAVLQAPGVTAIVNTGPPPDELAWMNEQWFGFGGERTQLRVADDEQPLTALAGLGISPDQVTHVIITPFQAYATGNIDRFPKARIVLSRRGWQEFHLPRYPGHQPRKMEIPDRILAHLVTDAWDRVRLVGDEEIVPGLRTVWAGCHHRSSLLVCVDTPKGTVAVSDCFFRYQNVENNHPIGIMESYEECVTAYEKARAQAQIQVPLYDPAVLERHPGGVIA